MYDRSGVAQLKKVPSPSRFLGWCGIKYYLLRRIVPKLFTGIFVKNFDFSSPSIHQPSTSQFSSCHSQQTISSWRQHCAFAKEQTTPNTTPKQCRHWKTTTK